MAKGVAHDLIDDSYTIYIFFLSLFVYTITRTFVDYCYHDYYPIQYNDCRTDTLPFETEYTRATPGAYNFSSFFYSRNTFTRSL